MVLRRMVPQQAAAPQIEFEPLYPAIDNHQRMKEESRNPTNMMKEDARIGKHSTYLAPSNVLAVQTRM